MQENGTQFWVEMDNFTMIRNVSGVIPYWIPWREVYKETNELYPVISVGNVTSSISNSTTFLLIPPYYLGKTVEELKQIVSRQQVARSVATGFETYDHGQDNLCATESRSGWWFSKNVFSQYFCPNTKKVLCDHNIANNTNLNGYYHDDPNLNQRSIIICKNKDLDKCFIRYIQNGCQISEVGSNNDLISIKLTKTEMYLTRGP